ncbi:MAG: response regulator [Deltaproteobacteria bacterium]|nr:response regulator [Deltaproteobacteria bacterium]
MSFTSNEQSGNEPRRKPGMSIYEKLKNMKIVLIEDDPWIQNGLRMYFRYHGCVLESFENGAAAVDALTKDRADIIICDYWLPDLDGLTLLRKVRPYQQDTVTILITAYPSDGLREEAIRMGVRDFIPKPLTIQKLEASLEALIKDPAAREDNAD